MENSPAIKKDNPLMASTANRRGFETQAQQEDLIIPRAKLFQGLPKEYEEYPDAKPGQLINNITKEILPATFVPILRASEWIRFNARKNTDPGFDPSIDPGAVIWRSSDPEDPRVIAEGKFGPNGEVPLATKFLSFLSYFPGVNMPVIVSFSKTSFKAGRQLNSLLSFAVGDMWSSKFALGSKLISTPEYSYYVLTVNLAGKPTDEEMAICEALYGQFRHRKIEAETEPPAVAE
jgi:hypothetical protein